MWYLKQLLSFIDDVEYVMELIEAEKDNIPSLVDTLSDDEEIEDNPDDTELEKEINNIEI